MAFLVFVFVLLIIEGAWGPETTDDVLPLEVEEFEVTEIEGRLPKNGSPIAAAFKRSTMVKFVQSSTSPDSAE